MTGLRDLPDRWDAWAAEALTLANAIDDAPAAILLRGQAAAMSAAAEQLRTALAEEKPLEAR